MTEKEKMEKGLWYDANFDKELAEERRQAKALCFELNSTSPLEEEKREEILNKLLPNRGEGVGILSPFETDYGRNCFIGDHTDINRNAYLMDGAPIKFGSYCFVGPNFGAFTASHPIISGERNKGFEKARPITIGDNVWFGAYVTVLPGVVIGSNTVIGAGSVVTKDIPEGVIAAGNPCRVIRKITAEDSIMEVMKNEEKNFE